MQRMVITMRDVEGWPSDDVRNALDLTETNQRVLLHRARSRVRAALEDYYADHMTPPPSSTASCAATSPAGRSSSSSPPTSRATLPARDRAPLRGAHRRLRALHDLYRADARDARARGPRRSLEGLSPACRARAARRVRRLEGFGRMSERDVRRRRGRRRPGRRGRRRAARRERPVGRARRARARRRRVLLLGVHAVQGAAAPGQALAEARRVPGAARRSGRLDAAAALARRDEVIHDLDDSAQLPWLEERGVELVRGHGRLDGERRVVVGDDVLVARRAVVLAPGTAASVPPIPGLDEAMAWTNREGTTAKEVPESLIVLGGGPVGCRAGAGVGDARLASDAASRRRRACSPSEEDFAGAQVARRRSSSRRRRARRAKARARSARTPAGRVTVTLEGGETIDGRRVLVGAGPHAAHRRTRPGGPRLRGRQARRRSATTLQAGATTGSTSSATPTAASRSRTWASTRRAWPPTTSAATRARAARRRRASPRVDVHRAAGRRRRATPRPRARGAGSTSAASTSRRTPTPAAASSAGARAARRGSSSTRPAACSSASPSSAPRSRSCSTRRRSPSSPRSRSTDLWHAVPAFPTRSELWLRLLEEYGL